MEMNWEEFSEGAVVATQERIHVTLNKRGNFFLNRKAIEALGEPDAVGLLFDRRKRSIGMKRSSIEDAKGFRLKRKELKRTGGRVLYAANFCRHFGIYPDETLYFTNPEVGRDGVLVLSLHDVKTAARKRRGTSRRGDNKG